MHCEASTQRAMQLVAPDEPHCELPFAKQQSCAFMQSDLSSQRIVPAPVAHASLAHVYIVSGVPFGSMQHIELTHVFGPQ